MREREGFLRRMEERLSRASGWLAVRGPGEPAADELRLRAEALRRELERRRRTLAEAAREDVARVRATLRDMRDDYGAPLPRTAIRRQELELLQRHLQTTARLLPELSDVDSPDFTRATDEYERSWEEVERAFEEPGDGARA